MRTIALEEHYATQALLDTHAANRQNFLGPFPLLQDHLGHRAGSRFERRR
jgi:hypothetical protein